MESTNSITKNTTIPATTNIWRLTVNTSVEEILAELDKTISKPNELVFFIKGISTSLPKTSQRQLCYELREKITPHQSIEDARITRRNVLRIKTEDIRCAESILKLKSILGVEVSTSLAYDSISSTILIKNVYVDYTLEDILEQLTFNGIKVLELRRFIRKNDSGITPTRTVLCKYVGFQPLEYVTIYYSRFYCQTYYERPRQCHRCYRFGHFKSTCRGKMCCGKCGSDHDTSSCTSEEFKCINCKGDHASFDIKCPIYLEEIKVLEIMSNQRCSYSDAKIERNRQLQALSEGERLEAEQYQQNEIQSLIRLELGNEIKNLLEEFRREISEILRNGIKSIIQEITNSVEAMINNHVNSLGNRERTAAFRQKG